MSGPPPARGERRAWSELPGRVLAELERMLGSTVQATASQPSGFSPGIAVRVVLRDGRRAFVKAVGPEPNPDSPALHRRELEVMSALPVDSPVPRLIGGVDEGEGGWVALALEDVDAQHPAEPWRSDELERVVSGAHALVEALTPSPLDTPQVGTRLAESINSWHLVDSTEHLDTWSQRRLEDLVELEATAADVAGETLLHLDIRADNLLLTDADVYFVDWPHAYVGPAWVDAVAFAPSVTMQGGPEPETLFARWPGAADADPDEVTAVVASIAGFFTYRAQLPSPPGLPTLRAFQAAQGEVARRWLAERTGWR
ncbi:MAG TPA: aminoglycoside phosphotransferase family protein [Gaiellaceae bacterium]|nr:aminoglycoside phosphotransferase family protein [Gaiellaceae bacterium]